MSTESFANPEVAESNFTEVSELSYEPLAPSYAGTIIIEWFFYLLIGASISIVVNLISGNRIIEFIRVYAAVPYLIILLSVFIWAPIVAKAKGVGIREKDVHFKSGVIWHKTVSLPYNRIQHIELESGPLDRIFKQATLKFFTAGGGSADMKIPGLEFNRASKLKAYVLKKAGIADESDDASLGNS